MQNMHKRMYPEGVAVETGNYLGTHINGPDYVKVIEAFGGYGERVEDPGGIAGRAEARLRTRFVRAGQPCLTW